MAKYLFPSISIFLSILSAGHSASDPFDILNYGNDILKITRNKDDVYNLIEGLWSNAISKHPFHPSGVFDANQAVIFLGVIGDTRTECLTTAGRRKMQDGGSSCRTKVVNNSDIIENFLSTIDKINGHMEAINNMYRRVFQNASVDVGSEPFELTDALYKTINDGCHNASTCLFHQIAGEHASKINPGGRILTSSSVAGIVFQTYFLIISYFLKGYAADRYRNDKHSNESVLMSVSQEKFLNHTQSIASAARSAIKNASTDIVLGEPTESELSGHSYMELTWYVSQVIVNEANLNPAHRCLRTCDYYERARFHRYGNVPSAGRAVCSGTMSGCYLQTLGQICPAKTSSRRYGGIVGQKRVHWWTPAIIDRVSYGKVATCDSNNQIRTDNLYYVPRIGNGCDVCTCLCDDHNNPETIRTFSLREVTSNIAENMVITGLRLIEINGTIYIRVRQGRMLNINHVDKTSWPRVDTFDKSAFPMDSFTMGWPSPNTVNLDTISYQQDFVRQHIVENHHHHFFFPNTQYVLTGVKFVNQQGSLGFSIRLSAWNAETKTISQRRWNNWIINEKVKHREQILLGSPDIPTRATDNVEFKGKDYYVQFQPTDNAKDFGQTTVPFLDHRAVITAPPMPLSGAGLFYKGQQGYGGVIGLKLTTIEFSDFIVHEL